MKHLILTVLLFTTLNLFGQRDTFNYSILIDLDTDEIAYDDATDTTARYIYLNGGHTFDEEYLFVKDVDTMQYFIDSLVFDWGNQIIEEQQRLEYIYNLFKDNNSRLHNLISKYTLFRQRYYDTYGYYPPESPYEP